VTEGGEAAVPYRVSGDHSHYTRGREVGLLMEVPGVRRLEERPLGEADRRRRLEERGEEARRRRHPPMEERGVAEMMQEAMEGEEDGRGPGEGVEFRPRRLRLPWPEEVTLILCPVRFHWTISSPV
jgi:hypothetical protein